MTALKSLHTFGFEAEAKHLLRIDDLSDLSKLVDISTPFYVLGGGSNSAFVSDFDGLIVLMAIKGLDIQETENGWEITVAAGENWHGLVENLIAQQIPGLENLALIPGTVGGAAVQNIGAYGAELAQFCSSVKGVILDEALAPFCLDTKACKFGYRDSIFKQQPNRYLITHVQLYLPKKNRLITDYGPLSQMKEPTPQKIFQTVIRIRQSKLPDPAVIGNGGSFFKNPVITNEHLQHLQQRWPSIPHFNQPAGQVKIPTAWLLDTLGYKGKIVGGIQSYEKQPLVLVNLGHGNGAELLSLATQMKQMVVETFGITLENEVTLIGQYGEIEL